MEQFLPFIFICLTSFFTLANPLGTMPVLLSMTQGMSQAQRKRIILRAVTIAFLILVAFTVGGQVLFTLFGISANGFKIAAGFIILKIGFDMMQATYTHIKMGDAEMKQYADDISITPLAIPMLCGPGAIANGIVLMETAHNWEMKGILLLCIAAIYVLTYFILRASTFLVPFIGDTGNNVMMRLMGLILMVIAVEIFVNGLKPIVIDVIRQGNGLPVL